MLGLKRGKVAVVDHQTEWEEIAASTIKKLKEIFVLSDRQFVSRLDNINSRVKNKKKAGAKCPA